MSRETCAHAVKLQCGLANKKVLRSRQLSCGMNLLAHKKASLYYQLKDQNIITTIWRQ